LYSGAGSLTQTVVSEIQNAGGIITLEDFTTYEPKWGKPVVSELFNGETLYTFPLPSTGHVAKFIMNVLSGFNFENRDFASHSKDKLIFHRIMEAFKFGFAKRTKLGDEASVEVIKTLEELESSAYAKSIRGQIADERTFNDYKHYGANTSVISDQGTGHISVLAPNGDAVALTATINSM
jgi:gamma-glutamyltranspeptidase / glutathione hydrolase / leukotriene-C4 hydrolase